MNILARKTSRSGEAPIVVVVVVASPEPRPPEPPRPWWQSALPWISVAVAEGLRWIARGHGVPL